MKYLNNPHNVHFPKNDVNPKTTNFGMQLLKICEGLLK